MRIYSDGACSGNPGPGGWGWIAEDGRHGSGGEPSTTNQRMEVFAVLDALRVVTDGPVTVVSDSKYVVDCFQKRWFEGWRRRGWKTSAGRAVANQDLWRPLIDLVEDRGDVRFEWVKGHSGDPMNEEADRLAVAACAQQRCL